MSLAFIVSFLFATAAGFVYLNVTDEMPQILTMTVLGLSLLFFLYFAPWELQLTMLVYIVYKSGLFFSFSQNS
ncbi:MAG: hypothetical protein ACRC2J_12985 [Microcoleaceae cyanobacterium]